jgi:hypothetical protein
VSGARQAVLLLAALLASVPCRAAEAGGGGVGPCRRDAARLCADVESGQGRRIRCLRQHQSELSPGCRQALTDAPPTPETGPAPASKTAPGADFRGKKEAVELVSLLGAAPAAQRIKVLLAALESDPQNMDALLSLRGTAWKLQAAELGASRVSGEDGAQSARRRRAITSLLLAIGNGYVVDLCLKGVAELNDGRPFLARDSFARCAALDTFQSVRTHMARYEGRLQTPPGASVLFDDLGALRWPAALDALRPLLSGATGPRAAELRELEARLKRHIEAEEGVSRRGSPYLDELAGAPLGRLEDALIAARLHGLPELEKRAQKIARDAYFRARIAGEVSPAPSSSASKAERDAAFAELHYNRGLQAYLAADPVMAEQEWRQALDLNPRLEKSRKALSRVAEESRLSKEGASEE